VRFLLALAAALALTGAVAACGTDDIRDAAVDQCLNEAERIQEPAARAAAEEGCRVAEDGDVSADDAKAAARERCLEATRDIANAQARREAEARCEDIR
jgi:hypothetical protein